MANELSAIWVFWHSLSNKRGNKNDASQNYEAELIPLTEVKTVQQFFCAFSYLHSISELKKNDCVSFFRKGRKPMWENSPSGGCWIIKIAKKEALKADFYWETFVIECMRGEFSQDIDGVLVTVKVYEITFQVWMHEAAASHTKVAEEIKNALRLPKLEMYLKYHKDSIEDLSTFRNSVLITC